MKNSNSMKMKNMNKSNKIATTSVRKIITTTT